MRTSIPVLLFIILVFDALDPAVASAQRLPTDVTPQHYDLAFTIDLDKAAFTGRETIKVAVASSTRTIVLNALELTLSEVSVIAGTSRQPADVEMNAERQQATLTVAEAIPAGPAEIRLTFAGALNDQLRGLYLSTVENERYAVTQFESTDARRAFPCFDEPAFKATFALTVTAPADRMVISNGAVVSDRPTGRQHTVTFSTTPKMSTYLVAIAVGRFACASGTAEGVPIRICATPQNKAYTELALEYAREILTFYNRYFVMKYPFGKLDVVAVPDFAAGAMENTAAIFYREADLLADAKTASAATRRNIASVLAHEMAHQWFGDLVTMQWWDDIWLNEGFATWMANLPLMAAHEDWQMDVAEASETQTALALDGLRATRPIHARVETPGEIEEAFDAIAYEKGAAVLRMIEGYVGAETFRKGVNAYLQTHAYGNATSQDFWSAIARTSGKPVDRIMPTFVNQPGTPLVEAAIACADGRTSLTLAQQRFSLEPLPPAAAGETWQIPVCLKSAEPGGARCDVLDEQKETIALDAKSCAPWVFVNAGAKGYFRSAYPPEVLRAIAPHVETSLTAPERLSLVGDEWALVRARRHTIADYLTLVDGFGGEPSAPVLADIGGSLQFTHEYLTDEATRPQLEALVRRLFAAALTRTGLTPSSGDSDARRRLRATLVDLLGTTGEDSQVVATARAALDAALRGGPPFDPTSADAIVTVAARHGDRALFDALLAASARAGSPEERYRYLYAITDFRDPALIERALEYTLSPDLRSQDAPIFLGQILGNPAARPRAWTFVKAHWPELQPKLTISLGDVAVVRALGAFCDAGTRDEIKAFFSEHRLPAAARTLDLTIERINNCIALRTSQAPVLAQYFAR